MELQKNNKKSTVFSGVQPSGVLHLGNYLGALAQWVEMQNQNNCIFCVVDYHAITVKQEPKELNHRILDVVKTYLAAGINPEKSVIFQQSDITAHTELAWILNCATARMADLNKMTQFKDKAKIITAKMEHRNSKGEIVDERIVQGELIGNRINANVGVGLFDYPVLMAADILLYNTDAVPVGDDQVQHVELTRTLAQRFNRDYGQVFKVPEAAVRKQGARIMGLDDPTKKMSKSASSPANYIALTDAPETAAKKIMRAVTDSGSEIKFDQKKKPAISNLMTIYSLLSDTSIKELEKKYQGKGYGDFKKDLAEVVKEFLTEFQIKYNSFADDDVKQILKDGAEKIRPIAEATLEKAKKNLGIN
ncbi:MAG: tryptophan--tRNA ligase [Patescibacteria group bacterium]|jgi:tryptophanyl-tRNA synthetase